ncbi:prephenate dehydratase [Desulforamulus ferrireducens]|uniref:Prephenate dehydratase n=1 Tax=Desulforamulus ferrireducens TaxID=1833852 RepID=A0A1S6IUM8_9FIRM|nr:prephenate dehydratase [Desulforamulus ferrireducens]AQS58490.1 hypothetical protein B0537_04955 [Desulforamulus ferrireducens]
MEVIKQPQGLEESVQGRRIGYLGPQETYSYQAALQYVAEGKAEFVPCNTLEDVCRSVLAGNCTEGILPIENLLEGSVNQVLDLLLENPRLTIQGEILLTISHCLLVSGGSQADIKTVLSHPQALGQCRQYLAKHLPQAKQVAVESTALAAQQVLEAGQVGLAAIAPLSAAQKYGLKVLAENIQDQPHNCTRFVVVGTEQVPWGKGSYKTSLAVTGLDRPGTLHSILKEFAWQGINLTRIESRPAKTFLGEYVFYIDLAGHRCQPEVAEALQRVAEQNRGLRIFGSYPACSQGPRLEQAPPEDTLPSLRLDIDLIDRQLIQLLGKRLRLAQRIGDSEKQREQQVLESVRLLASQQGLAPDVVEEMYRLLLNYSGQT